MAQKVTLYRTDKHEQYLNVTDTNVSHGVLTFYWSASPQAKKKITTTVPFVLEEDVA